MTAHRPWVSPGTTRRRAVRAVRTARTARAARFAVGVGAIVSTLAVGLAGCSGGGGSSSPDGSSASPGSSGGGSSGAAASGAGTAGSSRGAASPSRPVSTPVPIKVTPPLRPTCSMLDRATAARLLGVSTSGRAADVRNPSAGTRQLDGCTYPAAGGRSLEYLVWSVAVTNPTGSAPSLPANLPASRFDPGVGTSSSGVMITAGGRTNVVVTASRAGRLVQVTVNGPDAAQARKSATGAAKLLVDAR